LELSDAMIDVRPSRHDFVVEVRGLDTARALTPDQVRFVEDQMDWFAVVIFKEQANLSDDAQLAFSKRFGRLHASITTNRTDMDRRLQRDELSDISNIDRAGKTLPPDHSRRLQQRANLLWHTDNSFRAPAGLYTVLGARIVTPVGGETEFADARAAYDALPETMRQRIDGLQVEHSLAHSRHLAGTGGVFDREEAQRFPATVQPLVRVQERTGRRALYIGSHAWRVVGWSYEDSQALLRELLEFTTQDRFVHRHSWSMGDLVMWDNRVTLHRGLPFDDVRHQRDLRRTSLMLDSDLTP